MKRTALIRHTPLRPKAPHKVWRRDPDDMVTEAEGNYVAARDYRCVMATLDASHQCRDIFGNHISSRGEYQIDHVDNGGVGNRGPSKRTNLVRLCPWGHRTKTENARLWRPLLREYLARVEGKAA